MRSSYKRIGQFVQQVNNRNTGAAIVDLKGININKQFMPSVANINGTDLSTYKVASKYQFAYNPMHVGRDEVLPIGLLQSDNPVIVSPAYVVFEIIDPAALLPEYLMMWCRRPEFDRNAWFTTDSSVRGGFNWDDFCDMTLPVPDPDKQGEIVREYNTIVERININEQLHKKLEETAQALYKQWFVDFEFPISKEYAESIAMPELEGKPYKASGGEICPINELEQDIPKIWEIDCFTNVIDLKGGGTPRTEEPNYWNGNIPFFTPKDVGSSYYSTTTEKYITNLGFKNSSTKLYEKNTVFITARGTVGAVAIASKPMAMNQSCYAAIGKYGINQYFVHQHILDSIKRLKNEANGGVFGALVTRDFDAQKIINPDKKVISTFGRTIAPIYEKLKLVQEETNFLCSLKGLLLGKLAQIGRNP